MKKIVLILGLMGLMFSCMENEDNSKGEAKYYLIKYKDNFGTIHINRWKKLDNVKADSLAVMESQDPPDSVIIVKQAYSN